ncbi:hypothetical protein ISCGN_028465 [Ixodes scapularis]
MEVVKSLAALLKDSPASLIEKEEDHVQPAFPVMQVRGWASSSPLTVVLEDCSFEVTDIVAGSLKVFAYADDVAVVCSLRTQVSEVIRHITDFCDAPGAEMNKDKSAGAWLGDWDPKPQRYLGITWTETAELRILRLLLEVRLQNRDTHQLLSQLDGRMARLEASGAEAAPPPPVFAETSLPRLPAMTVAELEEANEAIRDECVVTALKKRLINMGGKKPTEVVANIMKAVMTLPGQVKFSLYGNKGKRPFISMGLCTLALGGGCRPTPVSAISLLVGALAGHMAARLPNEDDCDGASYLPPVQSEPVVRLLQPMIDGEEEHYDYMGTVLHA